MLNGGIPVIPVYPGLQFTQKVGHVSQITCIYIYISHSPTLSYPAYHLSQPQPTNQPTNLPTLIDEDANPSQPASQKPPPPRALPRPRDHRAVGRLPLRHGARQHDRASASRAEISIRPAYLAQVDRRRYGTAWQLLPPALLPEVSRCLVDEADKGRWLAVLYQVPASFPA